MKQIYCLLIVTVLFASCAGPARSSKKSSEKSSFKSAGMPGWVNNPTDNCTINELCAVGEGTGALNAEAKARDAMAKIFKTEVKSKLKAQSYSEQKSDGDGIISGETSSDLHSTVEESTNEILKGVEIKEKYVGPDSVFALAVLNKSRAANGFRSEMQNIDKKMTEYFKDGSRSKLFQAIRLHAVREDLNLKYEFLSGGKFPDKVSYAALQAKRREWRDKNVVVYVAMEETGSIGELKKLVVQELANSDYKVVTNASEGYQFMVKGSLSSEKKYFNVKGFQRYSFVLNLQSKNKANQKVGGLSFSSSQNGRSFTQAYHQALPEIKRYIRENLDKLKID